MPRGIASGGLSSRGNTKSVSTKAASVAHTGSSVSTVVTVWQMH